MYNRQAAVTYANQWWYRSNLQFPTFSVDCTNFVSQCLLVGGAPMKCANRRDQGWWMKWHPEN